MSAQFPDYIVNYIAEYPVSGILGASKSGPTFFVANGGSDSADGKTPATAWQTITKVNAQTFAAGTTISFNGGQSFTGAIALTNTNCPLGNVSLANYGTGQATISSTTSAAVTATNVQCRRDIGGDKLSGHGRLVLRLSMISQG